MLRHNATAPLQSLRVIVNDALADREDPSGGRARAWLWNSQTSGGTAMAQAGRETGYEVRFSKYDDAG